MRGSINAFRKVGLVAVAVAGVLAPATVSAAPKPKEVEVLFISRAELEAAGLMTSDTLAPTPQLWCLWDCNYVRNSRSVGTTNEFVARVSGPGPGTLAMDITRQVSNSFTATVTVSADKISAAVGFSVTWTDTQTYKYSTTLPSGACWTIRAYNTMDTYAFEVWQNAFIGPDFKVGTGGPSDSWESGSRSPRLAEPGRLPAGSTGPQAVPVSPKLMDMAPWVARYAGPVAKLHRRTLDWCSARGRCLHDGDLRGAPAKVRAPRRLGE